MDWMFHVSSYQKVRWYKNWCGCDTIEVGMRIVITSEARATAHTSKKLDIWLSIWYNGICEGERGK